jgi:GNAT superfamily N-acetyltransferase
MNIEIKKLTPDLLQDWLYFFDNSAACAGNEWAGCYCMAPHWSAALENEAKWEYSPSGAAQRRKRAAEYIKNGAMRGYLAYVDGKAAGWCNANDKRAYDSIFYRLPRQNSEKDKKIKAIACFFTAPDLRGKGIAAKLLEKLCADAAAEGCAYVEAYPFIQNKNKACTGPISMYEKAGFALQDANDIALIYRKYL